MHTKCKIRKCYKVYIMERLLLETVPFRNDSFNKNTSVCFTRFFSGDEKQIEMREKTLMIVVNRAEWQM